MTTSSSATPSTATAAAPVVDRSVLRLAVTAHLTRYKGMSRAHTEADLRMYLDWSPATVLTHSPPAERTSSCTYGGCRRPAGCVMTPPPNGAT